MTASRLQFSVVIPVYNRPKLLFKVLDSLNRQSLSKSKFEVIVVDDGSTDKEVGMILRGSFAKSLQLRVLKQQNAGPARAREHGAQKAYAPWIAYIDSDCYAAENWLEAYADTLADLGDAAEATGALEGLTRAGLPPDANEVVLENAVERSAFTHETENLTGGKYPTCNMLVRKELCLFFPGYTRKHYFREDTDLAFSILESGYSITFAEAAVVYHPSLPATWDTPIRLALRYLYDPLLKKRFPGRYHTVDAHKIAGITVSHLRKKIYALYCLGSIAAVVAAALGLTVAALPLSLVFAAGALLGWLGVIYLHSRSSGGGAGFIKDMVLIAGLSLVVPWVLFYSLFKGKLRFAGTKRFNKEAYLAGYPAALATGKSNPPEP